MKFTRDNFLKAWDEAARASYAQPQLIADLTTANKLEPDVVADNAAQWLVKAGRVKKSSANAVKSTIKVYAEVADKMAIIIEEATARSATSAQFRSACRLIRDGKAIKTAFNTILKKKPKAKLDEAKFIERLNKLWNEAVNALGESKATKTLESWYNSEPE